MAGRDIKCQPRAAVVLLNRSGGAREIRVAMDAVVRGPGFESWEEAFRRKMVARVSVRK